MENDANTSSRANDQDQNGARQQDAQTWRVVFLDVLSAAVQAVITRVFTPRFTLQFAASADRAHQMSLCREADFLVVGATMVDAALLQAAGRVRLIHKWGVGVDRIDIQEAKRLGIPVAITNGANAGAVAELAVALILAVYRRICWADREMRVGRWPVAHMRESCFQIRGKTVGLIGFGNIGRRLAQCLSGFEPAQILYCDPCPVPPDVEQALGVRRVELPALLAASDIVSLHAPCVDGTRHLINAQTLAATKPDAILINTARGELVDEAALYQALVSGRLLGAGLDVFDPEPVDPANLLLSLDQIVVTPHAGSVAFDNVASLAAHVRHNLEQCLDHVPLAPQDVIVNTDRRLPCRH